MTLVRMCKAASNLKLRFGKDMTEKDKNMTASTTGSHALQKKLTISYALMTGIIVLISIATIWQLNDTKQLAHQVSELRTPTTFASTTMLSGISHELSALRGWMLTGDEQFKQKRTTAWENEIEPSLATLQANSKNWTNPQNQARLAEIEQLLAEFEAERQKIEDIAQTIDNTPAIKMLLEEAAPLAQTMVSQITRIIDLELAVKEDTGRKALLGMMADVRGTTGLELANIRAFLLSGDEKFSAAYKKLAKKNDKRFAALKNSAKLLTKKQRQAFWVFADARKKFLPLPDKMLAMRGQEDWNLANYWMQTRLQPLSNKLQSLLTEMSRNQQQLLADDALAITNKSDFLILTMWIMLAIGFCVAIFLGKLAINTIVKPIAHFRDTLVNVEQNSDLTISADVSRNDEIGQMGVAFNLMLSKIKTVMVQVTAASIQLTTSSEALSSISAQANQGIQTQLLKSEQIATAINEMSATAQEVARSANTASLAANDADAQASEGENVVARAVESINDLNSDVQQIADVINMLSAESDNVGTVLDVIKDIAEQTNLLALNAAIEAARAGEQGRGFAVVADEVRTLAGRTQESTLEIQKMIEKFQHGTQSAVAVMESGKEKADSSVTEAGKAASALAEITRMVSKINDMNTQIASAAEEQTAVAEEINQNILSVNTITQQTSQGAQQTENSSRELSRLAMELQSLVQTFKT